MEKTKEKDRRRTMTAKMRVGIVEDIERGNGLPLVKVVGRAKESSCKHKGQIVLCDRCGGARPDCGYRNMDNDRTARGDLPSLGTDAVQKMFVDSGSKIHECAPEFWPSILVTPAKLDLIVRSAGVPEVIV
eukprot:4392894-Amphidinium_carterae.1